MLETLLYVGLGIVGLFLLAGLGIGLLILYIVVTTKDDPDGDVPVARYRTSDIAPPHDEALFNRLAREAMAYATRPYVTTIVDANGVFLLNTVSDVFGKRVYAESRRRVGKTLNVVICVYEDGNFVPKTSAATEIPATQVDWPAHLNALSDVTANGPTMSYVDHLGRRREIRIPKKRRHHA